MLEVYRSFAEETLAMPVIAGEKPENERFPGAVSTYSIEAMMQDGKALQAGTSHYLGTHFAEAQNIQFQNEAGELALCHTTSWGVSTRLIGGVIMTHGDDDGLRLPPAIAPRQVVVVPILRDKPEDADVLAYCEALADGTRASADALGAPVRAIVDKKPIKSADKRWNWVRRGAPVIIEIGPRDVDQRSGHLYAPRCAAGRREAQEPRRSESGVHCRDRRAARRDPDGALRRGQGPAGRQHHRRLQDASRRSPPISDRRRIRMTMKPARPSRAGSGFPGRRPTGAELDGVGEKLKALKLTIRNAPLDQPSAFGACVFTGRPGVEEILIGRAY